MKNGARGADRAQIERAQNGQRERLLSVRSRVQIPPSPLTTRVHKLEEVSFT